MLHHVSVGVADLERAAKFYDAALSTLGYKRVMEFMPHAVAYGVDSPAFWVQVPANREPPSVGNGTHIGFNAKTKSQVHAFHAAALKAGGTDNGAPGPRPDYGPEYYGAFVLDLDGNRLEALIYPMVDDKPSAKTKAKPRTKAKAKAKPAKKLATAKRKPAGRKGAARRAPRRPRKR